MSTHNLAPAADLPMPNGSGAAAVLAAGIGSFALALFALMADKLPHLKSAMIFYRPTGPLSGVTTSAVAVWLIVWVILHVRWRLREVSIKRTNIAAFTMVVLSIVLSFPPIVDLF